MRDDDETWGRLAHIHAQFSEHDDAYIVANSAGLRAIRGAIDEALEEGQAAVDLFVADGEGFSLRLHLDDTEFAEAGSPWAVPYVADFARESRPHALLPGQRNRDAR
jgi:uncharacterized protein YgfB (UPF0149 family)